MYDFHCNYIKANYGCGAKLLLKHTDDLVSKMYSLVAEKPGGFNIS